MKCFSEDMILWDSRLLHCNAPGFHPFDEMDLRIALVEVGLEDASPAPRRRCRMVQHDPAPRAGQGNVQLQVLSELTSVADAVWTWAAHEATLEE